MKAETYNNKYAVLIEKLRQLSTKETIEEIETFIKEELNYASSADLRNRISKVKEYESLSEEEIARLEKIYDMYKQQSGASSYSKQYANLIEKLRQLSTKEAKEEIKRFIEEELNCSYPVDLKNKIIKTIEYKLLSEEEITRLKKIYNMYKKESIDKTRVSYKNSNTYNIKYAELIEKLRQLSTKETKEEIKTFIEEELNYTSSTDLRNRIIKVKEYKSLSEEEIARLEKIYDIYTKIREQETIERHKNATVRRKEKLDKRDIENKENIFIVSLSHIEEFIESGQTKKEYITKNHITYTEFEKMVKYVERLYPELYFNYKSYLYCQETELEYIIETTLPLILEGLRHGVLENETKRNFDIIDFYSIVKSNISVDEYYQKAKRYQFFNSIDEQHLYCKFASKYTDTDLTNIEIITYLDGYTEINSKKDKYGLPIIGTGRVITEEEKIEMLSFLKSNNIPISNNSLRDITTRYLSGNKDKSKQATK